MPVWPGFRGWLPIQRPTVAEAGLPDGPFERHEKTRWSRWAVCRGPVGRRAESGKAGPTDFAW